MIEWLKNPKWDDLKADAQYKETEKFAKEFEPQEGKSYKWVYNHALYQFNDITEALNDLDKKADSMIKYLAPSSGILGTVFVYFLSQGNYTGIIILVLFGVFLVIVSMALSVYSLMPLTQSMLPSIRQAIEAAEYFSDENQACGSFVTGIDLAIKMKRHINRIKAVRIKWSYRIFFIALFWLFFITPLIYVIFY